MLTVPRIGPGEAVQRAFTRALTFDGRSRRSEYWWFFLFQAMISAGLQIVDARLLHVHYGRLFGLDGVLGFGSADLWSLVLLVPNVSLTARRLHDVGRSGWWQLLSPLLVGSLGLPVWVTSGWGILLSLVALIGGIVLLVWTCQDSTPASNRWGASPKYVGPPAAGYFPAA